MSTNDLADLAWDLASAGFDGREAAVFQVVRTARAASVPVVLTDILADADQPPVARLRAFGRISALLAAIGTQPLTSAARAA